MERTPLRATFADDPLESMGGIVNCSGILHGGKRLRRRVVSNGPTTQPADKPEAFC